MPYFLFKYNLFSPRSICPLSRCTRCQGGCSPPPPSPPSPAPSPSCSPRQQTWFPNSKRERQTVKVAAKAPLCAASSFNESGLWNQGTLSEKITLSWLVIGHLRVFRPFFIHFQPFLRELIEPVCFNVHLLSNITPLQSIGSN